AALQAMVTRAGEDAVDLNEHTRIEPPPAGLAPVVKPVSKAPPPAPAGKEWKEAISKDGGYSVLLPTGGTQINTKQSLQIPGGPKLDINILGVDFGNDGSYMTMFADAPAGGPQLSPEQRFEGAKQGMLANIPGGKIVKEEKV